MAQRPHGQKDDQETGPPGRAVPSPADTWQDWVTIWQSELNALATDREMQLGWARMVDMWATHARAAGALLPDGAPGRARPQPSAGSATPYAAPDPGDVERQRLAIERLARRVEELERRLAKLGGSADN
jgi:hypothetical protein